MAKVVLMLPDESRTVDLHVSLRDGCGVKKDYFDFFRLVPGDEVKLYIHENV